MFFHDVKNKKDLDEIKFIFSKLKQFKYIYIFNFQADILHI